MNKKECSFGCEHPYYGKNNTCPIHTKPNDKPSQINFLQVGRTIECSGPLSADHIVSRTHSKTYGMTDNVVCVCIGHHFFWKPSNPTLYTNRIDEFIGKKTRLELEKIARPVCQYSLKDWQEIEESLKTELTKYFP
mgnify:CR=1 FL=1